VEGYPLALICQDVLLCAILYVVYSSEMLVKCLYCIHPFEKTLLFYNSDEQNEHVLYYLQNHHVVQMNLH